MKLLSAITIAAMAVGTLFASKGYVSLTQNSEDRNTVSATVEPEMSDFDKAVNLIKKYEGLHQPKHYPLVGYGHLVLPGEKFSRNKAMGEAEAEKLLRKDLLKNCAVFRDWGADSLILGVLAYNIGSGNVLRSTVSKKLKAGDRDIYANYISHARYRGKIHSQIQKRRIEEFETLFIKDPSKKSSENFEKVVEETQSGKGALAQAAHLPMVSIIQKMTGLLADCISIPQRYVAQLAGVDTEQSREGTSIVNQKNLWMACI